MHSLGRKTEEVSAFLDLNLEYGREVWWCHVCKGGGGVEWWVGRVQSGGRKGEGSDNDQ